MLPKLSDIRFEVALLAGAASFCIGMLWYSPYLFGKLRQGIVGYSDKDMRQSNMWMVFFATFCLLTVMAAGLEYLCFTDQTVSWQTGALYGLYAGIFLIVPSLGINMMYGSRSFLLWFIDAGYQVICLIAMGALLAYWG